MKKDTVLVVLFIILAILSMALFMLDDVIQGDTTVLQVIIAIVLFGIGIGAYIYLKK
ncbi:MAG: hypothetical protein RR481_08585 [Longicatena sp.]